MEFKSGDKLHLNVGAQPARVVEFVSIAISRLVISHPRDQRGLQKTEAAAVVIIDGKEDLVPISKLSKIEMSTGSITV